MSPTPRPRHRHARHLTDNDEALADHLEIVHRHPITSLCYEGVLEHIHNLLHAGKPVEFVAGKEERY